MRPPSGLKRRLEQSDAPAVAIVAGDSPMSLLKAETQDGLSEAQKTSFKVIEPSSTKTEDENPAQDNAALEDQLFRAEAVAYSRRRLQGDVIIASPPGLRLYGALLIAIIAVATIFAVTATYSRKEIVSGWIQPEGGLIRATTLQAGMIEEISVKEGQEVKKGAVLARVRLSPDIANGWTGELLQRSLDAEYKAAHDRLSVGRRSLALKRKRLIEEREHGLGEVAEAKERLRLAEGRAELARLDQVRTEKLVEEEAFPRSRLETAESTMLNARSGVSSARSQVTSLQEHLEDAEHQLANLPTEEADLEAQTNVTLAQITQRQTSTAAQSTYVITAPVDGRVLAIPVELGQSLPAGGTITVLSPIGSSLVAEVYIPSRAAGFIKPGQDVKLMYDAFPHEKFGSAAGVVARVSSTVLGPGEIAIPGLEIREPVFRMRVSLEKQSVETYGQTLPLQPGMLLKAMVVVDRRSLFEWMLDPIYAAGMR